MFPFWFGRIHSLYEVKFNLVEKIFAWYQRNNCKQLLFILTLLNTPKINKQA